MVRRGGENVLPHTAAAGHPPHAPGDHTRALPKQALRVPRPPAWPLAMFPLVGEQNRQLSVCHSPKAVGTQPCVPGKDEFPENTADKSQDRVLTGGRDGADTRSARPSAAGLRLFFLLTGDDLVGLRRRAVQYTPCLRPENVPLSLICCSHSFTCAFIYPSVHPTNQRGRLRGQCPSLSLHVGRRRPGARSATHVPGPGPAHGPRRPCRAKPRRSRTHVRI